ncbi:MAG: hypothetical protein FWG10_05400 [Eubacteriaceae bacterium]|nr:hypothetical protein [Eubacteriaceae bacterium]
MENTNNTSCPPLPLAEAITNMVIVFLEIFVCATHAKRIVYLLLFAAGIDPAIAGKLCGVCLGTA